MIKKIGSSSVALLSQTIIIIPFFIFLNMVNRTNTLSILPFIAFYSLRMTGIFLIRGIKTKINSYNLLQISIICGIVGSIFGTIGFFNPILYVFSGILLGLSAAWLPISNSTMVQYRKKTNSEYKNNNIITMTIALLLGSPLLLPTSYKVPILFLIYGIMYLLSFIASFNFKEYRNNSDELEAVSPKHLLVFVTSIILLISLRSSRLIFSTSEYDIFIYGFVILLIISIPSYLFLRNKIHKKVSKELTYLGIINGSVGNYLFLFCSIYAKGFYGQNSIFIRMYLPYILGIALSSTIYKKIGNNKDYKSLAMIIIGLLTILLTNFFSIGVLITSLSKSILNKNILFYYQELNTVSEDKKMWVKQSIQNTGSLLQQFTMMAAGSILLLKNGEFIKRIYTIMNRDTPTLSSKVLMNHWNIMTTTLLIIIILTFSIYFYTKKSNSVHKS